MHRVHCAFLAGLAIIAGPALAAQAADPESCKAVRFADVGWTDITATTALTSRILEGLGYTPSNQVLSVPVTYASLKNKDIDVFLGNWMPTMEADLKPYVEDKSVEVIETPNLEGAKYTLAVPTYTLTRPGSSRSATSPSSRMPSAARSTASSRATTATA